MERRRVYGKNEITIALALSAYEDSVKNGNADA